MKIKIKIRQSKLINANDIPGAWIKFTTLWRVTDSKKCYKANILTIFFKTLSKSWQNVSSLGSLEKSHQDLTILTRLEKKQRHLEAKFSKTVKGDISFKRLQNVRSGVSLERSPQDRNWGKFNGMKYLTTTCPNV